MAMSDRALSNFTRFMQSRGIRPRDFGPGGAYDAAISKGRDDEPDDKPSSSAIAGMLALKAKMSAEGFRALCAELCGGEAEDGDEYETPQERLEAEAYPGGKRATDEPPFYKGRPRTGGGIDKAMDGVSLAYDVKRGASYSPAFSYSGDRAGSSKAARQLAEMFPGFGDVKVR
jgi:hypothetical protein